MMKKSKLIVGLVFFLRPSLLKFRKHKSMRLDFYKDLDGNFTFA
jgi:hypothetical protein